MKKMIMLCAVLCMTCTFLFGTASAVSLDDYPPLPSVDYAHGYIVWEGDILYFIAANQPAQIFPLDIGALHIENGISYQYIPDENCWQIAEEIEMIDYPLDYVDVFYATTDIHNIDDGSLYFKANWVIPSADHENALADVADVSTMLGALSEVLGMVAIVIPVVIGFFGIRKGIAWLFARIRGV